MPNLLKILPGDLSDGLTTAEAGLLGSAAAGETLELRTGDFVMDRPENAGLWGAERTIRSEFLSWLCRSMPYAYPLGISVRGARIAGPLNLDSAEMRMPLSLSRCALDDIILLDASIPSVDLSGCICGELVADGLRAGGGVQIDRLKARGEVRFNGANVGLLHGRGARFESRGVYAFSADRLCVGHNLDLTGSFSSGWVRMLDVHVGGGVRLDKLRVHNYGSYSISLDKLSVKGGFRMRGAELAGEFQMPGASIGGFLEVSGSWCRNPGDIAFGLNGIRVGLDVWLERLSLQGTLVLDGALIDGSLDISGSMLDGTGRAALTAVGMEARGGVFLRDTKAEGGVLLGSANVGGSLYIQRSGFSSGGVALGLGGARVSGLLSMDGDTRFEGILDLSGARAGRLSDARGSWPADGYLLMDGFGYGWLHGRGTPVDGASRVEWLRLAPKKPFRRGPYVQLARVLHLMGRERDMRTVVEAMYEDMKAAGELKLAKRAWRWLRQGKGDLGLPGV